MMVRCETCNNEYDKTFQVIMEGVTHHFDSFECAIQALAPVCSHCGCRILGHGVEASGSFYCCANCARANAITDLSDRPSKELLAA